MTANLEPPSKVPGYCILIVGLAISPAAGLSVAAVFTGDSTLLPPVFSMVSLLVAMVVLAVGVHWFNYDKKVGRYGPPK